jgi:hypothetical protein
VKQFIRNVRAAKTIADERAVVQKESAAIRASFREESHDSNVRCVSISRLKGHTLTLQQEKQRREAALSLHLGRADALWPDRMPEVIGLSALRGQAIGVLGYHVAAGRESGGSDASHKLAQEVGLSFASKV